MHLIQIIVKKEAVLVIVHCNGGNAIFLVDFKTNSLANISGLIEYYGTTIVDGFIWRKPNNYVGEYRNYLFAGVKIMKLLLVLLTVVKELLHQYQQG